MSRHGTVIHEEYGIEYALDYEFVDGELEVVRWKMNDFELDIWARVEDILKDKAYAQERERQSCGVLNYD